MGRYNSMTCCPICGVPFKKHHGGCKEATLRAIDAANTAAERGNDAHWYEEQKTYHQRLKAGILILNAAYHE